MPIRVVQNKQLGIIEVNAFGALLRSDLEQANAEIQRIHDEEGVDKILGDATKVEKIPSTTDSYVVWSAFPQYFRHAIVVRKSDPASRDAQFVEDVGVNRGQNLKFFETREEALRWLFEK